MSGNVRVLELFLSNYRNHRSLKIETEKKIIFISGKNGSGKTNILESISLLTTSSGMRNADLYSLVNQKSKAHEFAVILKLKLNKVVKLGIGLSSKTNNLRKIIKVDGKIESNNKLAQHIKVFWLLPYMYNMFNGTSLERRNFFDSLIIHVDENHKKNLTNYQKLQKERLKIIKSFSLSESQKSWLNTIEKKMSVLGVIICDSRRQFLKKINRFSSANHFSFPEIELSLDGIIDRDFERKPSLEVEKTIVKKLYENRKVDSIIGRTQFGINKTDLKVYIKSKDMFVNNCSTGEQKITMVAVIFLFIMFLKDRNVLNLIFLLDDLFANLDEFYVKIILDELVKLNIQTWITDVSCNYLNKDLKYSDQTLFLNINDM